MLKSTKKSNLSVKTKALVEKVYLDYASSTPMNEQVFSVMAKVIKKNFANSGAIHELGLEAKKILETARKDVAQVLGAHSDEIIFTSGSTESNNLVVAGVVVKNSQNFFPHIVTTNIEHPSILEVCKYLEKTGQAEVTFVPVEENGIIDTKKIKKAIKENTVLVSVIYANNEIGTIQPILEIAKEIRHYKKFKESQKEFPLFHVDATQAMNYLMINVEKLGVDLLSFNGTKIYGPKGTGVLFKKRGVYITPLMQGGGQEFDSRPGTENIASACSIAEALKITEKMKEKESKRLTELRDYFIQKLLKLDANIKINGDLKNRLPNNINITVPKIPSDLLVIELSARGVYVSEKSACKSKDSQSSYVIKAICTKRNKDQTGDIGSLRFSLGRQTTKSHINYTIKILADILRKLKKWYY